METFTVTADEQPLAKLIAQIGFAQSNGEARRLIQQGGVTLDGHKITDPNARVTIPSEPIILKVGKRRVCSIQSAGQAKD
jgi:tyrosyl-tRNA synthetase